MGLIFCLIPTTNIPSCSIIVRSQKKAKLIHSRNSNYNNKLK
ncbi:hypothetical protein MtrunA17_Chr3g0079911 [Medicago truncatula]|uniref:Uncharacterized protein n=1 Tax=Medicago truncatula TaxID=3880 RepID=A0A396III7_MEDTR|nr:hypothetical protein MtrunA17_Chr3g0079911 [Medicago truncatula]